MVAKNAKANRIIIGIWIAYILSSILLTSSWMERGSLIILLTPVIVGLAFIVYTIEYLNPKTKLIPSFLKHTWEAALVGVAGIVIQSMIIPLLFVTKYTPLEIMVGILWLLSPSGRGFISWIIMDLRNHKKTGRSLFQHSHNCITLSKAN